jgi:hypothetical protein
LDGIIAHADDFASRSSISFAMSGLKRGKGSRPQKCVGPPNVPRSLTAIALSFWSHQRQLLEQVEEWDLRRVVH